MKILDNFKFPAAAWIILVHELLERFSFYGMRAIVTIYLNKYLGISETNTTIIYHLFVAVACFLPLIGAIISDNYLGRFKTIFIFGLVYLIGHLMMPLTALVKNIAGPLVGLFILAIGTGTIKPCVAAFGGDQIDEFNEIMLNNYFSLFYVSINIGAFVSQMITPILRKDIKCINDACYPLAFGVPAFVFILTYVLLLVGKPWYKIIPNESNVLTKFCKCLMHAISRWFTQRKTDRKEELLDYADDKYDHQFISDSKKTLSILVLFLPFPLFWALFDQQGSRWIFQANKMNGDISFYTIEPDQMQSINPLGIVLSIPLFNIVIYPLLSKCNVLKSAPSRIVAGYVFAALSFVCAGFVEIAIDRTFTNIIPNDVAKLSVINYAIEPIDISIASQNLRIREKENKVMNLNVNGVFNIAVNYSSVQYNYSVNTKSGSLNSICFYQNENKSLMVSKLVQHQITAGHTKARIFVGFDAVENSTFKMIDQADMSKTIDLFTYNKMEIFSDYESLKRGSYQIFSEENGLSKFNLEISRSSIMTVGIFNDSVKGFEVVKSIELEAGEIHMLWQIPQYLVMVYAEILFSVTAMSFAYSEAPSSMKALLQSAYLITIFAGNMIVVVVASSKSSLGLALEFFIFAILVTIGGLINGVLAWRFLLMKGSKRIS